MDRPTARSTGSDPGIIVLRNETNQGIGAAMKRVFQYALDHGYDVLVIHAGNDKDDPLEIPSLLEPIANGTADFVQGSRYLGGGGFGNMPAYRVFGTRVVHPLIFSLAARKRVTESTNGFRAFRTAILRDPRIDWRQDVARPLRARAVSDAEGDPAGLPPRARCR